MSRIGHAFDALQKGGRKGLVTYVTAGDPDLPRSAEVIRGLARGGADVIEVGVPFSDPIADGPAIQRASERALAAGSGLGRSIDLVAGLRKDVAAPIVLFTYVNPVFRMGVDAFVNRAADAGVDGVLLLDLPIEESEDMRERLASRDIDQIFLVSPTTTDDRLRVAGRLGRGFLYAISRLGVTGTREAVASTAAPLVRRVRETSALPIALGFGISRPEHVAEVWTFADAAVVGSAIVEVVAAAARDGGAPGEAVERFVRWLKEPVRRGED
jgi:tryptophan synthase alpha chain